MKTEFFVKYDLFDTTALQDAQENTENNAPFADMSLLKDNVSVPSYGTLEHNFFVLDGKLEEFPDEPDNFAYFSAVQSDENGIFPDETQIEIVFAENHTSYGLTLYFLDMYPLEIEVVWYDLLGILQSKKKFYPDDLRYFCKNQVEDYGKIVIRFLKGLPYHNVKLQYIEYGTTIIWGTDKIKSGKLVNDTDPTSDKIVTDKLTFDFVDVTNEFNLGNAGGMHKLFQRKQKMLPYEIVNGVAIPLGAFFLDSNTTSKNICKLSAIDYKGMLANTDFKDGRIYKGDKAGSIITEIMEAAGIEDYEVDLETANTPIYGTLKIQTCQKALREVLFACGSIINTAHRTDIIIRKVNKKVTSSIGRNRKFSTTLKTDKHISDVTVKYKDWSLDEKVSEIAKGTYGVGIHTIQLTNPATNLTTSTGTIVKQMPYYLVLQIDTESRADIVISGQKYVGNEVAVTSSIEHIKAGEVRNAKTFSGSLLDFNSAKKVADNILEYYQLQQIIQTKYLSDNESAGEWAEIENVMIGHVNFVAAIESLITDLTGGFISTAKCRGYFKHTMSYYYADSEIYADEAMGAII